jgi:large subunit ribosomal protein L7/L12
MSEKIEKILGEIENLTVLELSELVKACEEKFGVSAAASVAVAAPASAADAGAASSAEQTEFDVILSESGDQKIKVIKVVREITGLGLKEAKALVDGVPKTLKEKVDKKSAEEMKSKLEAEGAKVEIK